MSADTEQRAVDFRVLGPLEVVAFGRTLRLGGTRQRRLLAVLLLNANTVVSYDRIMDVLWEKPPRSARQQIHNLTAQLRTMLALGIDAVELATVPDGYRLAVPPETVDVFRFQDGVREAQRCFALGRIEATAPLLQQALGEWHGAALTGLADRHLAAVAAGLEEQRLDAVECLLSVRLRLGEAGSLVGELLELVGEHPFRDGFRADLMTALLRSGRQADALAVFDEGRRLLAEELGLDPSARLRRVHQEVLAGDTDADVATVGAGAAGVGADAPSADPEDGQAGAAAAVPESDDARSGWRFLPRDTSEFTGRKEEIARLVRPARRPAAGSLVIDAVDGMGGVGKTTLAVHMAHRIAADHPDGQYFIDLHGFSPRQDPLTPAEALHALLRDSGCPPEQIPDDVAGSSALWRSRLAGQRTVLLLDNALDAAQVRPLLPGTAGTRVLITSRRRLSALEGAVSHTLDVLPRADATALFAHVVGRDRAAAEPEAVAASVELCGRLPLAIRIAAAHLRDRCSWTVGDLVTRLGDHRSRARLLATGDRDVLAVLALSHRRLTPGQRLAFRLLSLHPGEEFDAHALAALTGLPLAEAEAVLETLFEGNLLIQGEAGRFSFHGLVRDCAEDLLGLHDSPAVQQAALERLLGRLRCASPTGPRRANQRTVEVDARG